MWKNCLSSALLLRLLTLLYFRPVKVFLLSAFCSLARLPLFGFYSKASAKRDKVNRN